MILLQVTIEEVGPDLMRVCIQGGSVAFLNGDATPFEVETAQRFAAKLQEAKMESVAAGNRIIEVTPHTEIVRNL